MKRVMTPKARRLRTNQTDAEKKLWRYLRNRQLAGCKFRLQHEISTYIVDFVCFEIKLIIELDGGQHLEQQQYDKIITICLEYKGYYVILFWNPEVINGLEMVLEEIIRKLESFPPPPPPPPGGGGGKQKRKT